MCMYLRCAYTRSGVHVALCHLCLVQREGAHGVRMYRARARRCVRHVALCNQCLVWREGAYVACACFVVVVYCVLCADVVCAVLCRWLAALLCLAVLCCVVLYDTTNAVLC